MTRESASSRRLGPSRQLRKRQAQAGASQRLKGVSVYHGGRRRIQDQDLVLGNIQGSADCAFGQGWLRPIAKRHEDSLTPKTLGIEDCGQSGPEQEHAVL